MSAPAFLNPAGGVRYHLRAFRYGAKLWQPFRWALGEWLLGWEPPERTLVLLGPSGGYCLQPFLFERFERVVCLEPDPVARFVFQRRLSRAPLERRPVLELVAEDHLLEDPERLLRLLERLGESAVLFSNVLGQLRVLLGVTEREAPELVRVHAAVARAIEGRSWVSFHDRLSGELRLDFAQPLVADGRLSDAEVLEHLYAQPGETDPAPLGLTDHLTAGLFPSELPHAYFAWELEPGLFHAIEAVRAVRATPEPAST
ncbi:MAG TPA: hypothetical protein VKY73_01830 [Polyangiaceae bacterium]|nr:hypothetical protein [Polyangiaceae bacterium]